MSKNPGAGGGETLRACVKRSLEAYFQHLGEHRADGLYDMVIGEIEQPLLETVMHHCGGNQTRAAAILGISRSTLRKKLRLYRLD